MSASERQFTEAEQRRFRRRFHIVLIAAMVLALAAVIASILIRGPQL